MVKQVKTKTTLKVRFPVPALATALQAACLAAGQPADLPPVRRRVDVHHQEPDVQNGVERHGQRAAHQNHRVQERRCHRGGQKVTRILPFLLLLDYYRPPPFADLSRIRPTMLSAEGGMPCAAVSDRGLSAFFSTLRKVPLVQQLCTSIHTIILSILTLPPLMSRESGCGASEGAFLTRPRFSSIQLPRAPIARQRRVEAPGQLPRTSLQAPIRPPVTRTHVRHAICHLR